jgi:chromosome segregation ATPase
MTAHNRFLQQKEDNPGHASHEEVQSLELKISQLTNDLAEAQHLAKEKSQKLTEMLARVEILESEISTKKTTEAELEERAQEAIKENQVINEKCLTLMKENKKLTILKQKLERSLERLQKSNPETNSSGPEQDNPFGGNNEKQEPSLVSSSGVKRAIESNSVVSERKKILKTDEPASNVDSIAGHLLASRRMTVGSDQLLQDSSSEGQHPLKETTKGEPKPFNRRATLAATNRKTKPERNDKKTGSNGDCKQQ